MGSSVDANRIAGRTDLDDVICTDLGATTFEVAVLAGGHDALATRSLGCDSVARVDPGARHLRIGPSTADGVSILELDLVLGRLGADSALGAAADLDRDWARAAVRRQLADPLGLGVEEAAAAAVELFETRLRHAVVGRILDDGRLPSDFALLCYSGGGPLHVAGYTAGIPYRRVLVPEWSAGLGALGRASATLEYRCDRRLDLPLTPEQSEDEKAATAQLVSNAWRDLEERVCAEFDESPAHDGVEIAFTHLVRMQRLGGEEAVEVVSPLPELTAAGDIEALRAAAAEGGCVVVSATVKGEVRVQQLPVPRGVAGGPPVCGTRPVWWDGCWVHTPIHDAAAIRPGHRLSGPAIVEADSMTFPIPPDRTAWLDAQGMFHLEPRGRRPGRARRAARLRPTSGRGAAW